MTTIRIGNDIHVEWSVFSRNGTPYILDGSNVKLWLVSGPIKNEIVDFSTIGNVVSFLIDAKDIFRLGIYKMVLSLTDTASETEDSAFDFTEAFEIVSKTYSSSTDAVLDGNVVVTPSSIIDNIVVYNLTNAPDGEDLTSVDNVLKLRNRVATETTMGYVILRQNKSFAEQVTGTNTIYEIRYDFDLGGAEVEIPSGCVLKFNGGSLNNGALIGQESVIDAAAVKIFGDVQFSGTWNNASIFPEWFGAKGDGVTDDTDALAACAGFVNSVDNMVSVVMRPVNYIMTGELKFNKDVTIDGHGARIFFKYDNQSNYGIHICNGPANQLLSLTSCSGVSMDQKTRRIDCESIDSDIAVGDFIVLYDNTPYSYNKTRAYYHKGDFFKVSAIGNGYIDVTEDSTDSYGDTIVTEDEQEVTYVCSIYKLRTIRAVVKNLVLEQEFNSDAMSSCLRIRGGVGCVIDNVEASGVQFAHICLDFCYNTSITNCKVDFSSPAVNYNYGIAINTSKNITVRGNFLKTKRHGLDFGGAGSVIIPNRYILVENNIIDNYAVRTQIDEDDPEDAIACFSPHLNTEYVVLSGNVFKQGVVMGIPHSQLCDNIIYGGDKYFCAVLLGYQGTDTTIKNNKIVFTSNQQTNSRGVELVCAVFQIAKLFDDIDNINIVGNDIELVQGDRSTCRLLCFFSSSEYKLSRLTFEGNKCLTPLSGNNTVFAAPNAGVLGSLIFKNNHFRKAILRVDCTTVTIGSIVMEGNLIEDSYIYVYGFNQANTGFCRIYGNMVIGGSVYPLYLRSSKRIFATENSAILPEGTSFNQTLVCVQDCSNVVVRRNRAVAQPSVVNFYGAVCIGNNSNIEISDNDYEYSGNLLLRQTDTLTDANVVLKNVGATSERPAFAKTGTQYFDTSISPARPIYKSGSSWVDATGTTV